MVELREVEDNDDDNDDNDYDSDLVRNEANNSQSLISRHGVHTREQVKPTDAFFLVSNATLKPETGGHTH